MRKLAFFILALFFCSMVNGQYPFTRTYNINDGMYQSEATGAAMMHDSTFLVWETNRKISFFDSYNFFEADSNAVEAYLLSKIAYLQTGTVFRSAKKYYYYTNGEFYHIDKKPTSGLKNYFIDQNALFYRNGKQLYKFIEDSISWKAFGFIDPLLGEKVISDSISWKYFTVKNKAYLYNNPRKSVYTLVQNEVVLAKNEIDFSKIKPHLSILDSTVLINSLYHHSYLSDTHRSFSTGHRYTIFKYGSDFLMTKAKDKLVEPVAILNQTGLYPFQVNEQAIFFTNHTGLHKVNPNIIYFPSSSEEMITSLHTIFEDSKGKIWFGGYGDGFSAWDNNRLKKYEKYSSHRILPGAARHSSGINMLFTESGNGGLNILRDGILTPFSISIGERKNNPGYVIKEFDDGKLAFGLALNGLAIAENITAIPNQLKVIGKEEGLLLENVLCVDRDSRGRFWMGRPSKGIAVYDEQLDKAFTWLRNTEAFSLGAISMKKDHLNNLWMGTDKGLYFLKDPDEVSLGDTTLFEKTTHVGLPNGDNTLITFIEQVDNFLVVGNNTAVSFLDLDSFYENPENPIIYQLIYGEDIHGGGSEQNSVLFDSKRRLWIGSQDGASMIKWDDFFFDTTTNEIKIKEVKSGTNTINYQSGVSVTLPKDNRNCSIRFGPRKNPSMLKNIFFDYYLVNAKGDTIDSKLYDQDGVFQMSYVPPGKYKLTINARKHGQLIDTEKISIHAPLSLSENPLFWIALVAIGTIGLVIFVSFRSKQKKKILQRDLRLTRLGSEKDQLQIQAIISTFNPHFINNSLHWVQSRYNDDPKMVTLIDRLSKNIQYIFQKCRRGTAFHTLSEEIELVQNYFTIQQLRFDEPLQLILPDEEVLVKLGEFPILLMQLQIHVENAIEHGLRNRIGSSFVQISLIDQPEFIHIEISDDGTGRIEAQNIDSKGTENGTLMLNELHEIFNQNNILPITSEYVDGIFIDQKTMKKYGTKVIITLPRKYNYELNTTENLRNR